MSDEFALILESLELARKKLGCSNSGAYYRGHSSASHRLIPRLLRKDLDVRIETNVYYQCRIQAHSELRDCKSSWEILSLLQHYGVPTRLLDWTTSFAVAVFFAIAANPESPTIWVLNAFRMTQASKKASYPSLFVAGMDDLPDYHECFIERSQEWPYERPVFIEIPWNSRRVVSQAGFFSFHPNSTPMEENCAKYVRKIELPEGTIKSARHFLELAGVNEHSVFPDLAGLGAFFRTKYGL